MTRIGLRSLFLPSVQNTDGNASREGIEVLRADLAEAEAGPLPA